jgi:putative DNA primase/helicase
VWRPDTELSRFNRAKEICRRAAATLSKDTEKRQLQTAKTVAGVLSLAQSDPNIALPAAAWDANPMVLNTPDAAYDLSTGAVVDRNLHHLTQCTSVTPDFAAAAPVFQRFLQEVFQGDQELIDFMQRALGYTFTGNIREQVLLFLHGVGANGKSTLMDFVQWLAGTYALKLSATTLMTTRGADQHPTAIAQLRGRRLAVSSELDEGQFFNEPLIKELTGDTTMSARFMKQDFFTFTQTQKHVIIGNYKPRLRGGDPAIARRMLLVPFNAVFPPTSRDPAMPDKLRAEGPAVLAWLIRGAMLWHRDGLGVPERVRAASAEYMAVHDDLQLWIEEQCELHGETRASDLYASFRAWKERRGEHAQSATAWGERLALVPGMGKRKSNGWRYSPIRLKPMQWDA